MKRIIFMMMAVMFGLSVYAKDVKELVVTTTPPMSCQNCVNKIEKNIRFEKGIKNIEANLGAQKVTIKYDDEKTNPEKIEEAFKKIGYTVEVLNPEDGIPANGNCCEAAPQTCPEPTEGCSQSPSCCK